MVLNGLERHVQEQLQQELGKTRTAREAKFNVVRYADDFACTGATPAICETVRKHVQAFLNDRGLQLSAEKTRIVNIREGFEFLGWQIRKYGLPKKREVLLITPAKSSQKQHAKTLRDTIKRYRAVNQVDLINALNPIIRGWCNYHAPMVSQAVFEKMDNVLWLALWPWANRRHPNKGRRWVARRYFHRIGNRRWAFAAKHHDAQRQDQWVQLHYHAPTPIKRHVPIKARANPYDPIWKDYFQRRESRLVTETKPARKRRLWDRQQGRCRCCGQPLLIDEEWHEHHIIPKALGGNDKLDNLWLVHAACHHQHHANRDGTTAGSP